MFTAPALPSAQDPIALYGQIPPSYFPSVATQLVLQDLMFTVSAGGSPRSKGQPDPPPRPHPAEDISHRQALGRRGLLLGMEAESGSK